MLAAPESSCCPSTFGETEMRPEQPQVRKPGAPKLHEIGELLQRHVQVRISRSRERSDRRDVNSWIGHVNARIAGM